MAISRTRGRAGYEAATGQPRNDAYTGMLGISLGALIIGCILLFLDYSEYPAGKNPDKPPPPSQRPNVGAPAVPAVAPAGPGAGGG